MSNFPTVQQVSISRVVLYRLAYRFWMSMSASFAYMRFVATASAFDAFTVIARAVTFDVLWVTAATIETATLKAGVQVLYCLHVLEIACWLMWCHWCIPVGRKLSIDEVEKHRKVVLLQLPHLHVVHLGVVLRDLHDLRLQRCICYNMSDCNWSIWYE